MSTKKLYWGDSYQKEFDAKVAAVNGNQVTLDQTCFYARSGGQIGDTGEINGIRVTDTVFDETKENVAHILEKEPAFKVGDTVEVKIDKDRRDNLRNLHSAAHILYYIVIDKCGKLKSIGSNISPDKARMDFDYDGNFNEILPELEEKMNGFLSEGHEIVMKDDPEKADLQWWTCGDWKMPCGGTHVKNSKEVGKVKLKRKNMGTGKERIEITLS